MMAMQQKRISSAIVDAPDDGDEVEEPGQDDKVSKIFKEPKSETRERKVIMVKKGFEPQHEHHLDEDHESSGSSNSDLREVLNCIRDPRDIKHVCHISCPRLKKEECKVYKKSVSEDDGFVAPPFEYSQDFEIMGPKPVRIPIIHVKGCMHEMESSADLIKRVPELCKWCYCEDQGTSEEEPDNIHGVPEKVADPNEVGFLKWSFPKQAPIDETGLVDWKNFPQDSDLQDILNCMFPPKVFRANGEVWIQEVSAEVARRADVIKLIEVLDMKIEEQQIKKEGIDPVRQILYEQLFDELIREETVVSPETGLLLLRMRDELRMTIAAWESILAQANNYSLQQISKCGVSLKPLQREIDSYGEELVALEKGLSMFWDEQYLIKSEEQKKREYLLTDRKAELAPHQARNKLLKEQIRLLLNREDDNDTTQQSNLS